MNPRRVIAALSALSLLLAAPSVALAKPPGKPAAVKSGAAAGKAARHGAARGQANAAKATVRRGKPSLRAQKANLVVLSARADALKSSRLELRQQTLNARAAYKANPNSATRAAWRATAQAYMPVRRAHEAAREQRNTAHARYRRTKRQMSDALAAANKVAAAAPPAPARVARPAIRRQARINTPGGFAVVGRSPRDVYRVYDIVPTMSTIRGGGYATSLPKFRAESQAHYASINQLTQFPTNASLGAAGRSPTTMPVFPTLTGVVNQNGL